MKEIFLKTSDNVKIAINHHQSSHDTVVIIAHGWFMTKDSRPFADIAEALTPQYDVISLDFRGHGRSGGFFTFTAKENRDLKAIVEFARGQYKSVYLMGFSLGGALALIHSATKQNVDKVIAVSAPCDFDKIENHVWKKEAWIPTLQKFELKRWLSIRPNLFIYKKTKPIDIVDKIKVPTLFIAGELDPTVHPWHTQSLYEKALCEKQFALFNGCFHSEDLFLQEQEKFMTTCIKFLEKETECVN